MPSLQTFNSIKLVSQANMQLVAQISCQNNHHPWKYQVFREELSTSEVSGGMKWLRLHHEVLYGDGWRLLCSARLNRTAKPTRTYAWHITRMCLSHDREQWLTYATIPRWTQDRVQRLGREASEGCGPAEA